MYEIAMLRTISTSRLDDRFAPNLVWKMCC